MNKIKLLKELENKFNNFKIHEDLIGDIINIVSKSGNETNFIRKLGKRLDLLKAYKDETHLKCNDFEILSYEDNLYSMHIRDKIFNIRILYSFEKDGTILLHSFNERSGKKATDYATAIPVAKQRYLECTVYREDYHE